MSKILHLALDGKTLPKYIEDEPDEVVAARAAKVAADSDKRIAKQRRQEIGLKENLEKDRHDFIEGGSGSGNFGHAGRPGERGGSTKSEGGSLKDRQDRDALKKNMEHEYNRHSKVDEKASTPKDVWQKSYDKLRQAAVALGQHEKDHPEVLTNKSETVAGQKLGGYNDIFGSGATPKIWASENLDKELK